MGNYIHHRVKMLLEEAGDNLSSCASVNNDYAAFATIALPKFKKALRRPNLTSSQLRQILREGTLRHRISKTECSWSAFLADYIESAANGQ